MESSTLGANLGGHQKDMCLKHIGMCAQNMLTILSSKTDIIGECVERGGEAIWLS